ncbi:MAG: hypothetical protein LBM73_00525 [Candidatus Nomurabacteria bacterium]|jgi:hypothetical protein|nr:hypothetical protein [Candidatus Nomurabacteria bacterium]
MRLKKSKTKKTLIVAAALLGAVGIGAGVVGLDQNQPANAAQKYQYLIIRSQSGRGGTKYYNDLCETSKKVATVDAKHFVLSAPRGTWRQTITYRLGRSVHCAHFATIKYESSYTHHN